MKLDTSKVDLTNQNQKIFAGILLVGVLVLLYFLLPPFIVILKNLWIAAFLAIPIIFIALNPMLIWNIFKQLSWNLTKALIGQDKLGYMYRYHEYLLIKIGQLDQSIKNIGAIRVQIQRKVKELKESVNAYTAQYNAYKAKQTPDTILRTIANKLNIDKKLIETYVPKLEAIIKQEKYLQELHDNWAADAQDLLYTLDAKRDEYNTLKELSKATGTASEFLKGNSEEYKIYQESLRQIEVSVTQYTANLENFERKAQPILTSMSMEREVSADEGLRLIEEFNAGRVSLKV